MSGAKPSIAQAKAQAKALRVKLAEEGHAISHAKALELVAQQYGARDWNTFHAHLGYAEQPPFAPGARVTGRYLSQAFAGEIVAARKLSNGLYRLELHFDEPIDVVRFESFSNFRRRISADVSADGVSPARTSDGTPHLVID